MSFQPAGTYLPNRWVVAAHDMEHSDRIGATGIATAITWIANLAVYVPFVIDVPCVIMEWWWHNSTGTTAHNIDFGIYNEDFTKVQSLGSTAGGTVASDLQNTSNWTDLTLAPGAYYMAFSNDSVRIFLGSGDALGTYQAAGIVEQTTAFPLPSPAVPIVYARAFLPHFGFNCRSVAL